MARRPIIEPEAQRAAYYITKSQWTELYRDLYLQTHGEECGQEWLTDAQQRLRILKINGISK